MEYFKIIFLTLFLLGCESNAKEITQRIESKKEIKIKEPEKKQKIDLVKYLKEKAGINYNPTNKKYYSDTIQVADFKYLVYGKFNNIKPESRYFLTYFDSIKLISPAPSLIEMEGLGGYMYKERNYNFEDIIQLEDTNRDGETDFLVYNDMASGNGGNSTFEVFINLNSHFEHSPDFSQPNLNYDEKTNTFTSRYTGGHAGKIYGITTYKSNGKSLIPIKSEIQNYDKEREVYIKTITDLKTQEVKVEEI